MADFILRDVRSRAATLVPPSPDKDDDELLVSDFSSAFRIVNVCDEVGQTQSHHKQPQQHHPLFYPNSTCNCYKMSLILMQY